MKIKKIIVLFLLITLFLTIIIPTTASFADSSPSKDATINRVFSSGYGTAEIKIKQDYDFTLKESGSIDWELALTGLALCNSIQNDPNKATQLMDKMGYKYTNSYMDKVLGDAALDYPISSMGYKYIPTGKESGKNIFTIVVRGTKNFFDVLTDLTSSQTMFDACSKTVIFSFKDFAEEATGKTIEQLKNEDNYFFITGHSLGGATANCLSVDQTIMQLADNKKEKIYTYTFESPHTCINLWWMNPEEMSHAFNFKNQDDWVTHQFPHIGATTYGKDIPFDVNKLDDSIFQAIFPNAKGGSVLDAPWPINYPGGFFLHLFGHHDVGLNLVYILQHGFPEQWKEKAAASSSTADAPYIAMYQKIFDAYTDLIEHAYYADRIYCAEPLGITGDEDLINDLLAKNISDALIFECLNDANCHPYYAFYDLDKNGTPELFIGTSPDWNNGDIFIEDIFTFDGTNVIRHDDIDGFWDTVIPFEDGSVEVLADDWERLYFFEIDPSTGRFIKTTEDYYNDFNGNKTNKYVQKLVDEAKNNSFSKPVAKLQWKEFDAMRPEQSKYVSAYKPVLDPNTAQNAWSDLSYALFDIDGDGTKELIRETDYDCEADRTCAIYTIGSDGKAVEFDKNSDCFLSGYMMLSANKSGNLYIEGGRQGEQWVDRVFIKNGKISTELVKEYSYTDENDLHLENYEWQDLISDLGASYIPLAVYSPEPDYSLLYQAGS